MKIDKDEHIQGFNVRRSDGQKACIPPDATGYIDVQKLLAFAQGQDVFLESSPQPRRSTRERKLK